MITYKLIQFSDFAIKLVDGQPTGEMYNTKSNEVYLKWLEEGNEPLPAEE
jgi:hypothetical protein